MKINEKKKIHTIGICLDQLSLSKGDYARSRHPGEGTEMRPPPVYKSQENHGHRQVLRGPGPPRQP